MDIDGSNMAASLSPEKNIYIQPQLKGYLAKDDSSIKKYALSNRSRQDLKYKVYGGVRCLFSEEQVFYIIINFDLIFKFLIIVPTSSWILLLMMSYL